MKKWTEISKLCELSWKPPHSLNSAEADRVHGECSVFLPSWAAWRYTMSPEREKIGFSKTWDQLILFANIKHYLGKFGERRDKQIKTKPPGEEGCCGGEESKGEGFCDEKLPPQRLSVRSAPKKPLSNFFHVDFILLSCRNDKTIDSMHRKQSYYSLRVGAGTKQFGCL